MYLFLLLFLLKTAAIPKSVVIGACGASVGRLAAVTAFRLPFSVYFAAAAAFSMLAPLRMALIMRGITSFMSPTMP